VRDRHDPWHHQLFMPETGADLFTLAYGISGMALWKLRAYTVIAQRVIERPISQCHVRRAMIKLDSDVSDAAVRRLPYP
jgi:hypothetical protein